VSRQIHFNVFATIKSRLSTFYTICTTHSQEFIDISQWKLLKGVALADPHFHEPKKIDILINTEVSLMLSESASAQLGMACPA